MKPRRLVRPTYSFTEEEARRASDEWGFNCGPAALAAMLDLKPDDVRSAIPDFDAKRYTNPTMMAAALRSLGVSHHDCASTETWAIAGQLIGRSLRPGTESFPQYGLARIQWEGRWTEPGVPIVARYRKTHWIGTMVVWRGKDRFLRLFDVNGGWMSFEKWEDEIVPALTALYKGASGKWHVTHRWQLIFQESDE